MAEFTWTGNESIEVGKNPVFKVEDAGNDEYHMDVFLFTDTALESWI